jgi:DNA ligase (NAD+)
MVKSIPDLYRLTPAMLLRLPATKEKMATKLFDNIQKTKHLPLAMFLNGLGIEGAGQTTWEKLLEAFHTLSRLREATATDVAAIDGFAEKSAHQIVQGLARSSELMDELLAVGITPKAPEIDANGVLAGKIFVITGALSQPRKDIEALIKKSGGRIGSSVSKTTSVLITNETDSTSSKMQKAKSLGVQVWSEEQLMDQLGERR